MPVLLRSDIKVERVWSAGSDLFVVNCARVSTTGLDSDPETPFEGEALWGRIHSYIKHKHAGPFEHSVLCVRVECPIFVWRQWHRHRTMSYSEQSARYGKMAPVFWIPPTGRRMFKSEEHKPMTPCFEAGDDIDEAVVEGGLWDAYFSALESYKRLIEDNDVAPEVARACLPVAVYSAGYVTANLRNWLNFLSLRTSDPLADAPSYPQAEIEEAARQCEDLIKAQWPLTYRAWSELRRPSFEDL